MTEKQDSNKTRDVSDKVDALVRDLLLNIGSDLMESIGDSFPPDNFPALNEIFDEIEESGNPYCDDAMHSVCIINAKRIDEFLKSNSQK